MENKDGEIHVSETEASGGSKEGVVRWILIVGTLLAIVLLSIIWMTGALTQGDVEEEITVGAKMQAADDDEGKNTDSILGVDDGDGELTAGLED
ncbi:hypothetical protein OAS19_00525 [Altererythrobacter sp.]|nr:hypothetical protein [Altererythrobacter sp.]